MQKITILERYDDLSDHIESVIESADSNKKALGFLAASIFHDYAKKGCLYVAVEHVGGKAKYAGHLLFDLHYPKAKVLQIFSSPALRKMGVASTLVDHLKEELTKIGFISIYARVAEDLPEANKFWHSQGFYVQKLSPGGRTTNRKIITRVYELKSPQLFELSGINADNPLGLEQFSGLDLPLFLLDLNVLHDLNPRRPRHELAADIFRAERIGICRLAVSTELVEELRRTAQSGRPDSLLSLAGTLPAFKFTDSNEGKNLLSEIATLVFPHKLPSTLSLNDKSDLKHLATAIQHQLQGLITNDQAILDSYEKVRSHYGIQVLSPTVFQQISSDALGDESFEISPSDALVVRQIREEENGLVQKFLTKIGMTLSEINSSWGAITPPTGMVVRLGVWNDSDLIGYIIFHAWEPKAEVLAKAAIDESLNGAVETAKALLTKLIDHAVEIGAKKLKLETPTRQTIIRNDALKLGFLWSEIDRSFNKLIVGKAITPKSWESCASDLARSGGIKLPRDIPEFRNINQLIEFITPMGNKSFITLEALESLLSPALFCLLGRPAVITPISKGFSEQLFGHSSQKSLLPNTSASLYKEKHYFSDPKTLKLFKVGTLIFFYESLRKDGRGAIVAVAQVKHAYHKLQSDLQAIDLNPSVLDDKSIEKIGKSKMKTVTAFDNLILLPHHVSIDFLRSIGCGGANDLITTRGLNQLQISAILDEGFQL